MLMSEQWRTALISEGENSLQGKGDCVTVRWSATFLHIQWNLRLRSGSEASPCLRLLGSLTDYRELREDAVAYRIASSSAYDVELVDCNEVGRPRINSGLQVSLKGVGIGDWTVSLPLSSCHPALTSEQEAPLMPRVTGQAGYCSRNSLQLHLRVLSSTEERFDNICEAIGA
jgi:hypothetical protein